MYLIRRYPATSRQTPPMTPRATHTRVRVDPVSLGAWVVPEMGASVPLPDEASAALVVVSDNDMEPIDDPMVVAGGLVVVINFVVVAASVQVPKKQITAHKKER